MLCFEREHFQNETPGRPRLAGSREQLKLCKTADSAGVTLGECCVYLPVRYVTEDMN